MKAQVPRPLDRKPRRAGFTLIELVVVIIILGILAGLVVNIVDYLRRSANYGAAAHNQQALLNNLQLYRTSFGNGQYPDRFDSLLDAAATGKSTYLHSDLTGVFEVGALSGEELGTLTRSGITRVMDHGSDTSQMVQQSLQNSGVITRTLTSTGPVAVVNPATTNSTGLELLSSLYPGATPSTPAVPADVRIVLFGVGPANTAIGKTIQSPPLFTELDPTVNYGRFLIAVAVYNPREGRRAQIKAVLDPKGRVVNRQISEFWQSMNPD
jgi:prepilin-type N-terminal cleavage/methylation domain-containing protein